MITKFNIGQKVYFQASINEVISGVITKINIYMGPKNNIVVDYKMDQTGEKSLDGQWWPQEEIRGNLSE